ncbi:OmpH family outer membrane protein [Winogradskyella sp. 3972H.M.0a.05]|uniref:OmpH family outer membrane protein n=1 Tax=Winogradskyella sp. 3972H.M.0a.05 TaxID=2950277 RepID=UPI00339AE85C
MTKLKHLPILNFILLLAIVVFIMFKLLGDTNKEHIVFVDNIKLYNEFNMTKEINATEQQKINTQKKALEDLYKSLRSIEDKESTEAQKLRSQIETLNESMQRLQANYSTNLRNQIWKRLNSYIKEYGEDEGLEIILGTSGEGTIMYAKEAKDITNTVINYVNHRFEGKKRN